jgi:hypothetical protein
LQALRAVAEGEARCEEAGEEARQEVSGRPARRVPAMPARNTDYNEKGRCDPADNGLHRPNVFLAEPRLVQDAISGLGAQAPTRDASP